MMSKNADVLSQLKAGSKADRESQIGGLAKNVTKIGAKFSSYNQDLRSIG